ITEVMNPTPIDKKFEAFGWNVLVIDAHNYDEIKNAIKTAKETKGKPTVIVAKSIKGKGVSYMENNAAWHGNAPKEADYIIAINEIDAKIKELEAKVNG
ncbi:MAG: transketolase, partial [Ruminococcaceae bacterium]|nr:transketolase [Oscillospiraceae bacterium]